jgi:hypothetical protein
MGCIPTKPIRDGSISDPPSLAGDQQPVTQTETNQQVSTTTTFTNQENAVPHPQSSPKNGVDPKNLQPEPPAATSCFYGVYEGNFLMCRDKFQSKYDGTTMYKWRKTSILKVEGDDNSRIQVHFIGWADTFDIWIDLKKEMDKVAPIDYLTKAQCDTGQALSENQLATVKQYLETGILDTNQNNKNTNNNNNKNNNVHNNSNNNIVNMSVGQFVEGQMVRTIFVYLYLFYIIFSLVIYIYCIL